MTTEKIDHTAAREFLSQLHTLASMAQLKSMRVILDAAIHIENHNFRAASYCLLKALDSCSDISIWDTKVIALSDSLITWARAKKTNQS